jgi:hypothetical protein
MAMTILSHGPKPFVRGLQVWQDPGKALWRPRAPRFGGIQGYLKSMVEAIANSKLRRMERELELRGIRFDRPSESWVTRKPGPAGR